MAESRLFPKRKSEYDSEDHEINEIKKRKVALEVLICGHSGWQPAYGMCKIPNDTYLIMYAPFGSALHTAVPRAIADGVKIIRGNGVGISDLLQEAQAKQVEKDGTGRAAINESPINQGYKLVSRRMNPINILNMGFATTPQSKEAYLPKILNDYPFVHQPGDEIRNFHLSNPGEKDKLQTNSKTNIIVKNIGIDIPLSDDDNGIYLADVLKILEGNVLHYGGCPWNQEKLTGDEKRDIVYFEKSEIQNKYLNEPTDEQKKQMRAERFGIQRR